MAERMDEMSKVNIVKTEGIADRIAVLALNEAMRMQRWCLQPELLMESCDLVEIDGFYRRYVAVYPLFNDRTRSYKLELSLYKGERSKQWETGYLRMVHLTGQWTIQLLVSVKWNEGVPTVSLTDLSRR